MAKQYDSATGDRALAFLVEGAKLALSALADPEPKLISLFRLIRSFATDTPVPRITDPANNTDAAMSIPQTYTVHGNTNRGDLDHELVVWNAVAAPTPIQTIPIAKGTISSTATGEAWSVQLPGNLIQGGGAAWLEIRPALAQNVPHFAHRIRVVFSA